MTKIQYIPYGVWNTRRSRGTGMERNEVGSGLLIICKETDEAFLVKRSYAGQYWTLPGGKMKRTASGDWDDPLASAVKQGFEELRVLPVGRVRADPFYIEDKAKGRCYHVFALEVNEPERMNYSPRPNWEIGGHRWFSSRQLGARRDIYPGLKPVIIEALK